MAKMVTLLDLRNQAYRLADQEGATLRFPTAEVNGYVNAGVQALHDVMIASRGFPWLGRTFWEVHTVTSSGTAPPTIAAYEVYGDPVDSYDFYFKIVANNVGIITWAYSLDGGATYTTSGTTFSQAAGFPEMPVDNTGIFIDFPAGVYSSDNVWTAPFEPLVTVAGVKAYQLPLDFYRLHKVFVSMDSSTESFVEIPELPPNEEGQYRFSSQSAGGPQYYQIRPAPRTAPTRIDYLLLYPTPPSGTRVQINYFPVSPTLSDDADAVDGYNGWEEYCSYYAALQMALKDEDFDLADRLQAKLTKYERDIQGMVVARASRAPRIQDVKRGGGRWRTAGWWVRGW